VTSPISSSYWLCALFSQPTTRPDDGGGKSGLCPLSRRQTAAVLTRTLRDGALAIRPPEPGDASVLIDGRDDVFHRFMGDGAADPSPVACITVDGEVVGWVDYDVDRSWLLPGEVNVGYNVFALHRGNGYATRAVELLLQHLAQDTPYETATLLIDPGNERSLALARRARFDAHGELDGNPYWKRRVG
jgi:RimJ/RimL family protein N-acetyltransferase